MPLPTPSEDEGHGDFVDRCMGDGTMVEDYPEDDQRLAICENQWEDNRAMNMTTKRDGRRAGDQCRVHRRAFGVKGLEKRADGDELPDIIGYAAVFDVRTELWPGTTEEIAPGAFTRTLDDSPDVRALVDHDPANILGRTKADTLTLAEDKKGLRTRIRPPNTTVGRDIVESIRRGDVDQMSFAFQIVREEAEYDDDGTHYRLLDVELIDVSIVTFPAYETTVATLDEFRSRAKAPKKPEAKNGDTVVEKTEKVPEPDPGDLRRRATFQEMKGDQKEFEASINGGS